MHKRKKIMLIVPMLHQGGFERVCVATARLLEPYYDIYIVIFDSKDIAYDIKGLHVIDLHMGVKDSTIGKVFNIMKRSCAIRRLKRKLQIDIAYSFGSSANIVNVFSGKYAKVWVGLRSYMDMENKRNIRLFAKRADKVLCCSKRIEEEVRQKYDCGKAVTLYNPLDVAELRQKATEEPKLPWENREHIIASMGREDDVKGFWHLLKAFALVRQEISDAKLEIIGDGDFEEYKVLARELNIEEWVYFTGMQTNPFCYLKAAQLYVLTSYYEGFPNALIEAMALGVPVIATDCLTGPREILQERGESYGVLIDNMSPKKNMDSGVITEEEQRLADEMKRMFRDEAYRKEYCEMAVKRAYDFSNELYVENLRNWIDGRKIAFHLNCLEQGGAERVVSNLANQFAKEGYEVLIATEWYGENEFQIDDRVRRVHVGLQEEDAGKNRIVQFLHRVKYLHRFMRREHPDILIAFAQRANYRALMAAPGTKVPVMISIRTDPVGHYDAWADKIQIPLLFPRAAGCVFQTEGQRDFFAPFLQKNSRVILNPLNDKYIGVPKPVQRKKEVVQSGRLVDFKNQPLLLRAFIEVHRKHPDYILKIYGGDSFDGTKEILEDIIVRNNAQDYIWLMGASDTLEKDLTDAAVYAFSSDWEGLPNALLEAMALGLPIVATDCPCGGPRTVMKDGVNGLLIPIKNQSALENGINRLIEEPEYAERLGEQARKIAEIANAKAIYEQWRDYIEDICKNC